jgi:hypothetical protein
MHIFKFFLPILVFGGMALSMYATVDESSKYSRNGHDLAAIEAASGSHALDECESDTDCEGSSNLENKGIEMPITEHTK